MRCVRQVAALLGMGVVTLALSGLWVDHSDAFGKKKGGPTPPPDVGSGTASGHSSVKITEDSRFRKVINVGRDYIVDKIYDKASEALQIALDEKKDYFVQVTERDAFGGERTRWTSVKFEANNLIGSMPSIGLDTYELKYGATAKSLLDEAKKGGDRELLADVAQRYCHTAAGIEANEIVASIYLQRGQVFTAALRYEKLLQMNPERAKLSDLTLYKAAIAFHRAGDKKNKDIVWERLTKSMNGKGLKVGEDFVSVQKLETVFSETPAIDVVNVTAWPSWRGNERNTAQANGSPPIMDSHLWKRPTFMDKLDGFDDQDPDQNTRARVQKTVDQVNNANHAVLPGFFPIASQGIMVYRTQRDVRAVALKNISIKDEESGNVTKVKPGEILWKSIPHSRSLWTLLDKNNYRVKVDQWMGGQGGYDVVPGFSSFLYENTVIGTLFTDHRYVYAINDMGVPPHPSCFFFNQFNPNFNQFQMGDLKPLIMQNELYAYDLVTGKLKWDLNHDDASFRDSHFISLPISVGGKLYVLNERLKDPGQNVGNPFGGGMMNPIGGEAEIRLICIDPNKLITVNGNVKPTIVADQVLGDVMQHNRFVQDIGRRVNAAQLAYDEGILVCPTNAGEVFGIDLMTRSLVWSYPYRENAHAQIMLPGMQFFPQPGGKNPGTTTIYSKWKSSPPAIADGKLVFTAPDADSVHCVSLRDGKPLWKKAQQKGDLYMAGVYNGKVLVVSETAVRGLDLENGRQLWSVPTGDLPCGQGVASKGIYYIPLKKGEILAIDIVKGEIKAHNRAAPGGGAPGNLVFYEDMVLSQTVTEVAAYPQLIARLTAAKDESTKDPTNLVKLTDFGELLLKDGQVQPAVDALMKAYDEKPADPLGKRVRERLFEALTDLMQIDFNKADKNYLTTYKVLCSVPGNDTEEQHRKAKFFRLVGQGREAQGKLVEAFAMYKDFGGLPIYQQTGIPSQEDPNHKIPVNVWLRGRISGMLTKATAEQKGPLEDKIAEEWKIVDAKKDVDLIRSFVGMFDTPVRVGREARVRLAETIMERNERNSFLEAEMVLHQVLGSDFRNEAGTGGRALAALAELEEKKGKNDSLRLAAAYYRELARDYANTPVRGKKTGSELLSELATDKRYLPFLESGSNPFGPVKIAARDLGASAFTPPGFAFTPQGDSTPFAKQNRLMLVDSTNTFNPSLRFRDSVTNEDRWTVNLGRVEMNQYLYPQLYQQTNNINQAYSPNGRFKFYHVKGHLVVCQVGAMVYCLDGDSGKKLWEYQTTENIPANGLHYIQQTQHDSEGNPIFDFRNNQTNVVTKVHLGRIGAVQGSYVALVGNKGLTVHDPLRGTVLWKKADVSADSHVFGDEQYIFLAETNAGGGFGVGRTMRASDGEVLANVKNFADAYQTRIRTVGRKILAAESVQGNLVIRLYDILKGEDTWTKKFPAGSIVMHTEDNDIAGVIDPAGVMTVLNAHTGAELATSNLVQYRITAADVKGLKSPLLLQDSDRFYVALNHPIAAGKVWQGQLHTNFNNGTRCLPVNGWFLAVQRHDGKKQVGGKEVAFKKGDMAWHSYMPVNNQMIVLDQFDQSPIALFTVRYIEMQPNGGNRWISVTQSFNKAKGTMIHDSGIKLINGQPMFSAFSLDLKARTINLTGFSGSVQHYVDDGKEPAPPQGVMLQPGGTGQPFGGPGSGFGGGGFPGGFGGPAGGLMPGGGLRGGGVGGGGKLDPKVIQRLIDLQQKQAQPAPQIDVPIDILPAIERLPAKK